MNYSREELFNIPVNRLVDIIMEQQEELSKSGEYKKSFERLFYMVYREAKRLRPGEETVMDQDFETVSSKRGRKPYTPEQKAEAERIQQQKRKERYQRMKQEKEAQ